jgi:formylglycine-generating enzyme required for sulfatase activity
MDHSALPPVARIPAGELVTPASGEVGSGAIRRVVVDEFFIGITPVTNAEYAEFILETGRRPPAVYELPLIVTAGGRERERTFRQAAARYVWHKGSWPAERERHPVTLVRWDDALAYCRWLAARAALPVRLPTEAEWERAARGGLEGGAYPWGDGIDPSRANYLPDPSLKAAHGTRPVGSYPPNGYGLYDMAGNVWQWVLEQTGDPTPSPSEGATQSSPALRVVRGGAWLDTDVRLLRCDYRHLVPGDTYSYSIGFRIACSVD